MLSRLCHITIANSDIATTESCCLLSLLTTEYSNTTTLSELSLCQSLLQRHST